MNTFTWGVEYETNLLLNHTGSEDRAVVWTKDKTQVTTEFWDVLIGHEPYHGHYYLNGVPEKGIEVESIYNLEAQMGVFKGVGALPEFRQNVAHLAKKLRKIIQKKRIKIDGEAHTLFGYSDVGAEDEEELYLDASGTIPGVYPSLNEGYAGYRPTLFAYDIVGKPQLTCTIRLEYIYKLFELIHEYSDHYAEVTQPGNWVLTYMNVLPESGSTLERNQIRGFLLYLLHYYEQYKTYTMDRSQFHYFKSIFFIKPRTNPASLYSTLSNAQRAYLTRFEHALPNLEPTEYTLFLLHVLPTLNNKDCVYLKNLAGVPAGLYKYDTDDLETYMGLTDHKRNVKFNVPCVEPYGFKDEMQIPRISYEDIVGENPFTVDGVPATVWEWQTGTRCVAYEFRDLAGMVLTALRMKGEEENPAYASLLESDMIDPDQLNAMMDLIFTTFFRALFAPAKRVSKKKCPDGQVFDRSTKRCRQSKRKQKRAL